MNKNQEIKNFIVVGAGRSEVGHAISRGVIKGNSDYRLMMTTRDEYQPCVDILRANADRVSYHTGMDLSKRSKLLLFRDKVADFTQGEPYAVIMSTSYFPEHKPFIETSYKEAKEIRSANVEVPVEIMRILLPHMLDNGGGYNVGFSCQSTRHNYPFMCDFTGSKKSLDSYMKTLANEHGGHGIRFNNFALASVRTGFTINSKPNGDTNNYITPQKISDSVIDFVTNKNTFPLQNGQSLDMFTFSNIDLSLKGWASRIMTERNKLYIGAFLDWKPDQGKKFPRMKDYIQP